MRTTNRVAACLYLGRIGVIVASVPLVCAIGIWFTRIGDDAVLREKALAVTAGLSSAATRITTINDWVYHNQGFAKNKHFFLVPMLGPTPNQVLEWGGDCADKSRLVSAMLYELGIDSGVAQIFPCSACYPIHAIVEAEYEDGRMVVDPTWDIDYPAENGKYLGMQDLAGTSRGRDHLAELRRQRPVDDKIQRMPSTEATFDFAKGVNWEKNIASRTVAFALTSLGYDSEHMLRPHFLEDPKLALTLFLLAVAAILIVGSLLLGLMFPALSAWARPPDRAPRKAAIGPEDEITA